MRIPRLVVGAASSGGGKTSLTLGLLGAFAARGLDVRPFKAGPDYIDPSLHATVAGKPSYNLDPQLMGRSAVRESLARNGASADTVVIEGVMGYYDGQPASTADLAQLLRAPAVLAIDASGAAESCAAVALGFVRYRRRSGIRGFILNRTAGDSHYLRTKSAVESATGLPVFGRLPEDPGLALPERHLGLAPDKADFRRVAANLATAVEAHIDLDALLALGREAPEVPEPVPRRGRPRRVEGSPEEERPVIAIARDEAFSFYYQDNLAILESLGAELRYFSPLRDSGFPRDASAVYLGGGYPELHASELEANVPMRDALRTAADSGMPIYAECGGYLYLLESLDDMTGVRRAGCGILPGRAHMGTRLAALGYRDCVTLKPSLAGPAVTRLRGHVFHYAWIEGADAEGAPDPLFHMSNVRYPDAPAVREGAARNSVLGSFLHVHFAANPAFARRFVRAALAYRRVACYYRPDTVRRITHA